MMNKITRQKIIDIITMIASDYPKDIDLSNKDLMRVKVNLWYDSLKEYNEKIIELAAKNSLQNNHFCPKLADIMQEIKKMENATQPTDDELWQTFITTANKAYSLSYNFRFTIKEENGLTQGENARNEVNEMFELLTPELKQFCGNVSQLITYGSMASNEQIQYLKPHFMKRISALKERSKIIDETPKDLLEMFTDVSEKMSLTQNNELLENKKGDKQ